VATFIVALSDNLAPCDLLSLMIPIKSRLSVIIIRGAVMSRGRIMI
jgi:hypothetical protein